MEVNKKNSELKHRLIIITDMENEPDDSQTMVKLLMYSNEIDIEGLIAVTSTHLRNEVYPESIYDRVKAYGIVRDNLLKHASGWPTEEYLLSIITSGPTGYGMEVVGDGKSTSGSDLIISAVDKDDSRPLYIAINAGANVLAQALWEVKQNRTKSEIEEFLSKIRIYDDSGQDDAGAWICHTFPDLFYVRSQSQVFSLYGPKLESGPQVCEPLDQWQWSEKHVRTRHGILGAVYPQRIVPRDSKNMGFHPIEGGGTTSWLGLINKGLYDPEEISWGGWGGRFSWEKEYVAAGQRGVAPIEEKYKPFKMYPQAADTWTDKGSDEEKTYKDNEFAPVWRWRDAYTRDFQARMDWCVEDYENANHHPVAAFYDDISRTIVSLQAIPGEEIILDSSKSSDPDGDSLSFKWYIYPEAGTYSGDIIIKNENKAVANVNIPEDAVDKQIHIILEVTDDNPIVSLTSYRRIVIDVK